MPVKLICFDLDETLINHTSWLRLSEGLNVTPEEDAHLLAEYKAGRISYDQWNEAVLQLYLRHGDSTRARITKILSNYSYNDGAREAVDYLKSKNYELVLISGSVDIIVDLVAKDLGFKYAKANNTFVFDEQGKLSSIHAIGDDTLGKAAHLESFCEMLNVKMTECACIGDGANDIEMFRRTGHGITFKGSKIEKDAWKVIDSLRNIPNIF